MELREFTEMIKNKIESYDENLEVNVVTVKKNNGIEYIGLSIKEENENIAPTIYMEYFYEKFKEGHSIECIMSNIFRIYEDSKEYAPKTEDLLEWEYAKRHVYPRLINKEWNKEYLQDKYWYEVEDLAVVLYIRLEDPAELKQTAGSKGGFGSVVINDTMINKWAKEFKEKCELEDMCFCRANITSILQAESKINARRLTYTCRGMSDILFNEMGIDQELPFQEEKMWVITTEEKIDGAIAILDSKFMNRVCKEIGTENLIILPSSRHEVIAMKGEENLDREDLKRMVEEVNETQVDQIDRLSDNIYTYQYKHKIRRWINE